MEESIAASKVGQENQFQGMEKFDEHDIYSDPRDEAISEGDFGEDSIKNSHVLSLSYRKNNSSHFRMYDEIDNELYNQMKKEICEMCKRYKVFYSQKKKESFSPFVIEIDGENVAVDGDLDMTQNQFRIHKEHPKHDLTIWATFYTGQLGMACCLGNPFDMLSKLKSTGKVKEQALLSFGEALPVFLPSMTLTAIFFLNFIYTTILTRPLAFRVPANSILLLLLFYYILALAEAMSGSGVLWGSVQISALLFVFGGAIGLMMLIGSIIIMVKFYFKRSLSKLG